MVRVYAANVAAEVIQLQPDRDRTDQPLVHHAMRLQSLIVNLDSAVPGGFLGPNPFPALVRGANLPENSELIKRCEVIHDYIVA